MVADDYRDLGAKILMPLARIIPLGPMGISFLSLLTALTAGYSFYVADLDANKSWLLVGSLMVFLTAVFDALDGIVARMRDLSSKRGDLVDHTLDRVADIIIVGGIAIGNLDDEGPKEMLIGSEVYLWLFTTEGQTDKPDLAIEGIDITYSPENPDEDEDIEIDVTVRNYGGVDAVDWRVKLYDGDPDAGGKKITEYSSGDDDVITASGGSISIQRTWYGVSTTPGLTL